MECNLVLSGGGVRGFAHVGVVKALREKNYRIKAISGTSSGALVGAFLCDGFEPEEITELFRKEKPAIKFNFRHLRQSILSFRRIEDILKNNLRSKNIEDLSIPLHISATDLRTGEMKVFDKGNLIKILTAASALPVFFPSVRIDDVPYADGGMSNNLPTEPFHTSDLKLVGVHVNPVVCYKESQGLRPTIDRMMHIIVRNNILNNIKKCDLFIEPPELVNFHVFEMDKAAELIRTGYEYTKKEIR